MKKVFALVIVLTLIVSLTAIPSFAAEPDAYDEYTTELPDPIPGVPRAPEEYIYDVQDPIPGVPRPRMISLIEVFYHWLFISKYGSDSIIEFNEPDYHPAQF